MNLTNQSRARLLAAAIGSAVALSTGTGQAGADTPPTEPPAATVQTDAAPPDAAPPYAAPPADTGPDVTQSDPIELDDIDSPTDAPQSSTPDPTATSDSDEEPTDEQEQPTAPPSPAPTTEPTAPDPVTEPITTPDADVVDADDVDQLSDRPQAASNIPPPDLGSIQPLPTRSLGSTGSPEPAATAPAATVPAAPAVELPPVVDGIAGTLRTLIGLPDASTPGTGNGPAPLFSLGMLWFAWRPEHFFFNQAPAIGEPPIIVATGPETSGAIGATDPDGDPLSYTLVDGPDHGTVTVSDDGSFVYTSTGTPTDDSFVVRVSDRDSGLHFHGLDSIWALFTGDSPHDADVTVSIVAPVSPWTLSSPAADGTVIGTAAAHQDGDDYSVDGITESSPGTYVLASGATVVFDTDDDGAYTGTFTYRPTAQQRWNAGGADEAVTDSFTIIGQHADGTDTVAEVTPAVAPSNELTLDTSVQSRLVAATGDYVYWTDNQNTVTIIDRTTGARRTVTLPAPNPGIGGMGLLPTDSDKYAVFSMYQGSDRGVAVVDLETGESNFYTTGGRDTYESAIISDDGTRLVVGISEDDLHTTSVIAFNLGQPSTPPVTYMGASGYASHAAFDEAPDGSVIAVLDDSGNIVAARFDQSGQVTQEWSVSNGGSATTVVSADGPVPILLSWHGGGDYTLYVLADESTPAGVSLTADKALIGSDGEAVYLLTQGATTTTTDIVAYRPATGASSPSVTVSGTVLGTGTGTTTDGRLWVATAVPADTTTDTTTATITYVTPDGDVATSELHASDGFTGSSIIRLDDVFAAVSTNPTGPITLLRPTPAVPLATDAM